MTGRQPRRPLGRGHPPMTSIAYLQWMLERDEQSHVTAEQIAGACNLDAASVKTALRRDVARGHLSCCVVDASCGGKGRYAYWLRHESAVRQYIDAWQAYLGYKRPIRTVKQAPAGLVADAVAGRVALEVAWGCR